MNFLAIAFNTLLYRPLFNALVFLYIYLPGQDFGVAVVVLTVLIKILFYPLGTQAIKAQKKLTELQPKIKEIQKKHKDKSEQGRLLIELYKKEKISPFAGLMPILIQIPVLIALYQILNQGLKLEGMDLLYGFIGKPEFIEPSFLGILNLNQPSLILAVLTGISQFLQVKMMEPSLSKKDQSLQKKDQTTQFSDMMQKQMLYFSPILTFFILLKIPSVFALYWLTGLLFTIIQQWILIKKAQPIEKNIS